MTKKIALAAAILGIILYCLYGSPAGSGDYEKELRQFRRTKNQSFRQSPESPLSATDKARFDSLKYYPADAAYLFACELHRNAHPDTVALPMSDNRTEKYLRWGQISFFPTYKNLEIHTLPDRLTLFLKANGTDSALFIPFTDLTNGHETYGGGRYLDAPIPASDATEIALDFNRAYNPYCAYSNDYSCPVPPAENRLRVAIAAGEKSFHE